MAYQSAPCGTQIRRRFLEMPDPKPYRPPYAFSVTIGETCNRKSRNFLELAEKLKMPVEDLMRQCNGHAPPSKALVKGLAKELDISESYLEKLADEYERIWARP